MKTTNIIRFIEPIKEDIRIHFKTQEVMKETTKQEFKFWNKYIIDITARLMFFSTLHDDEIEPHDMEKILLSLNELEEENIFYKWDREGDLLFYKNDKKEKIKLSSMYGKFNSK